MDFEDGPAYLAARAAGRFSLEGMLALLERIATAARTRGARRVLIDATAVAGDITDLDRYDLGKRAAELLAHIERIALLRAAHMRYTGFGIDVAQNRGLDVRVFLDAREASQWLEGP